MQNLRPRPRTKASDDDNFRDDRLWIPVLMMELEDIENLVGWIVGSISCRERQLLLLFLLKLYLFLLLISQQIGGKATGVGSGNRDEEVEGPKVEQVQMYHRREQLEHKEDKTS